MKFTWSSVNHRSKGANWVHHKDMPKWLANLPSNYTAQMALMGWFITLTSKMTGFTIPDVGRVPGGTIEQPRDAISHYLLDMETIVDAMAVQKNWDRPQYAILKEMYLDLKRMHYSFRVNRFWCQASSAPCPRCAWRRRRLMTNSQTTSLTMLVYCVQCNIIFLALCASASFFFKCDVDVGYQVRCVN